MDNLLNISSKELEQLGIVEWGFTTEPLAPSYKKYRDWPDKEKVKALSYLTGERGKKRSSIKNYYPDFQSALVFLFDYSNKRNQMESFYQSQHANGLKMASYVFAFGEEDYHNAIKTRLNKIANTLKRALPNLNWRTTIDVHPVLERDLAWRCGLGWFGKNSMLIHRQHGSFFLIGGLLLNQNPKLKPHPTETDHCGHCNACVEACPTHAINPETRTLNAQKCISTFTIEHFKDDTLPPENYPQKTTEIFGCDICQSTCPWNHPEKTGTEATPPKNKLVSFFLTRNVTEIIGELKELSNKKFLRLFKHTALARTGRVGLLKNLKYFQ